MMHSNNGAIRMQFKALIVLAASLTLASASSTKYNVGNCGDPSGIEKEATEKACDTVGGKFCGGETGSGRCIVEEGQWSDFEDACKGDCFQRPGSYDEETADKIALCQIGGLGL
ncbi:hypothetical protein FE257_010665 [Aspergillus nanangensis]|uniref:Uncharacterized protein n=1 Tax=Aspergillus nanangensis TaxID=2582783 RepID=A0AAD4CI33_ASPNN|nr:hypothetical protein FE257_010665 [Aspergillus nanangensis]